MDSNSGYDASTSSYSGEMPPLLPTNICLSRHERTALASAWLIDHPTFPVARAAKHWKVNRKSLTAKFKRALIRGERPYQHGGQNKGLTASQEEIVTRFIREYLEHNMLPTRGVIEGLVANLRQQEGKDPLSDSWFTKWWKSRSLHKIKTKPIACVRLSAQDEGLVDDFFYGSRGLIQAIQKYHVKKRNLINADESGFRIGCPRGVEVIVPLDVRELYSVSPENRRSVTIIKAIRAHGVSDIPPMIIVQGAKHMQSWYRKGLKDRELVELSERGFTTNEIGLRYLDHLIKETGSGPDQEYKILLMDNHGSHRTDEFNLKARVNNIIVLYFPAHLTQILQPLDVGCFRAEKHWHNDAVNAALENLDFDYTLSSFFRDLKKIREKTFTYGTVRDAWRKSGVMPPNRELIKKKMRKYYRQPEQELPTHTHRPITISRIEQDMAMIAAKTRDLLSSPTRKKQDDLIRDTSELLIDGEVFRAQTKHLYQKVDSMTRKRKHSRKVLQVSGEMYGYEAQER
jgi:hypothetical protein